MKTLLIISFLVISMGHRLALADTINLGQGSWVCAAEGTLSIPVSARANTENEAKALALQACSDLGGNDNFCKLLSVCNQDKFGENVDLNLVARTRSNGEDIYIEQTNGKSRFECTSSYNTRMYFSAAATELEAKVLIRKACAIEQKESEYSDCRKLKKAMNCYDFQETPKTSLKPLKSKAYSEDTETENTESKEIDAADILDEIVKRISLD